MPIQNTNPTETVAWKKLETHYQKTKSVHLKSLFEEDPVRANRFSIQWQEFFIDYSKNRISEQTLALLLELAEECGLKDAINKYFKGDLINQTEKRAVLHTALRDFESEEILVDGKNIIPEIKETREKIKSFSEGVIKGTVKGYNDKPFTDVVNIGIGGSDLGPVMVCEALAGYSNHLKTHFVSNVDGDHLYEILKNVERETTLFIIVSKTFTTQETLTNANSVKDWFLQEAPQNAIASHFVAVSTNLKKIDAFGIAPNRVFPMWDWVGGRFSLWSAVGLSVALTVGYKNYVALLKGAAAMDRHFAKAQFDKNIPIILALLGIWYNNFFKAQSLAIIPYCQYLSRFSAYLQQAVMESNGKNVSRKGAEVNWQTEGIIWGEPGTNSQHAFFQLLHQGTKTVPVDFIGFCESVNGNKVHHDKLMANFFAQTEALLHGKTVAQVRSELEDSRLGKSGIETLAPFKVFKGNVPSNTLLIKKLDPYNLGALIALYEHKIFVQGVIWNIFSFDQWGVELGKQLASKILKEFEGELSRSHDSSTLQLLRVFKQPGRVYTKNNVPD